LKAEKNVKYVFSNTERRDSTTQLKGDRDDTTVTAVGEAGVDQTSQRCSNEAEHVGRRTGRRLLASINLQSELRNFILYNENV